MEKPEKPYDIGQRPDNLLEALGIPYKGLTEEERAMKELLTKEYKENGKNLLEEVRKWRETNPEITSLGDAIRALYEAV